MLHGACNWHMQMHCDKCNQSLINILLMLMLRISWMKDRMQRNLTSHSTWMEGNLIQTTYIIFWCAVGKCTSEIANKLALAIYIYIYIYFIFKSNCVIFLQIVYLFTELNEWMTNCDTVLWEAKLHLNYKGIICLK